MRREVYHLNTYHPDGNANYHLVVKGDGIEKCTYTVEHNHDYVHVDRNTEANLAALMLDFGSKLSCSAEKQLIKVMQKIGHLN